MIWDHWVNAKNLNKSH